MLDPTRISLDAATVGFRTRMGQAVDWGSFNQALQTQSESIKVRRELEETPVNEVHVMGGQQFGIAGNQKTNEWARQQRQMNGYPLRSFLVTGGPVILPTKREEGLMAIPVNRGLTQYTQYNGVVGNYASSFTEPLTAPMASEMQMLARAGAQARSDSIVNPYKALQFQLNMHKTQAEIADNEARHRELRGYNKEGLLKTSMDTENAALSGKKLKRKILSTGAVASMKPNPQQLLMGRVRLKPGVTNPIRQAAQGLLDENVVIPEDTGERMLTGEEEFIGEANYPEEESKMGLEGEIHYPPQSPFMENLDPEDEVFIRQAADQYKLDKYQVKAIYLKYGRNLQRTLNELRDLQTQLYGQTMEGQTIVEGMEEGQQEMLFGNQPVTEEDRAYTDRLIRTFLREIEQESEALEQADMVSHDFNANDPFDAGVSRAISKVARVNEEASTINRGGLQLEMGYNESPASTSQSLIYQSPAVFGGSGVSDAPALGQLMMYKSPGDTPPSMKRLTIEEVRRFSAERNQKAAELGERVIKAKSGRTIRTLFPYTPPPPEKRKVKTKTIQPVATSSSYKKRINKSATGINDFDLDF